jgi:hypothetical protein
VPSRRQQLSLLAPIMGSFVGGLEATAVNVALPAIRTGWRHKPLQRAISM